jgi:hypothetical protein
MELVITALTCIGVSTILAVLWVRGFDYMEKNYPDYKGEDLFDEDLTKKPTKKDEKNKGTN